MHEQGAVKYPCGRSTYCGGTDRCRHVGFCSRRAAAERADAAVQKQQETHRRSGKSPKKRLVQPADVQYIYDGSFAGMLCCVHEAVYSSELPAGIFPYIDVQPTLFAQKQITTDQDKAEKVRASIPQKISGVALQLVETVFLSCLAEKEMATLRFLLLGYAEGPHVTQMLGHADVAAMLKAEKHLAGEAHLLKGFIRFSDYDGVLVATISPKNFVLPFLAPHFTARYSCENFLIYDKVHKAALIHQDGKSQVVPLQALETPAPSETELNYRAMWKQFYHTVAIEARYNPKCRMTHMPKRYWENMTEMAEQL